MHKEMMMKLAVNKIRIALSPVQHLFHIVADVSKSQKRLQW